MVLFLVKDGVYSPAPSWESQVMDLTHWNITPALCTFKNFLFLMMFIYLKDVYPYGPLIRVEDGVLVCLNCRNKIPPAVSFTKNRVCFLHLEAGKCKIKVTLWPKSSSTVLSSFSGRVEKGGETSFISLRITLKGIALMAKSLPAWCLGFDI